MAWRGFLLAAIFLRYGRDQAVHGIALPQAVAQSRVLGLRICERGVHDS
jgi:hypothetical protein